MPDNDNFDLLGRAEAVGGGAAAAEAAAAPSSQLSSSSHKTAGLGYLGCNLVSIPLDKRYTIKQTNVN